MKVELRITEDDYAKAAQFHEWPQVLRWPSAVILILLILAEIFAACWLPPDAAHILRVLAILWAVLAAVLMHVLVPYPPPPDVLAIQTYPGAKSLELADEGLRLGSVGDEAILPWRMIFQWRENNQFVLIYAMPRLLYPVPRSVAQQGFDISLLVRRLVEQVGPERQARWSFPVPSPIDVEIDKLSDNRTIN
jgi:hypothetical protein